MSLTRGLAASHQPDPCGRGSGRVLVLAAVCDDTAMDAGDRLATGPGALTGPAPSAAQVLQRAQQVAEQLSAQAEHDSQVAIEDAQRQQAEAAQLRAEALAIRDEAARLREAAEATQRDATSESARLVRDAGEQASMLIRAAGEERDSILAEAREQSAQQLQDAAAEADRTREQATLLRAEARAEADSILNESRRTLADANARIEEMEQTRHAEAERRAHEHVEAAGAHAQQVRAESEAAAAQLRAEAEGEAARIREELEGERAFAAAESERLLNETRSEVERQLASAAEQTEWTKKTVDALLAAADQERQHVIARGHGDVSRNAATTRRRIQQILHSTQERVRERADESRRASDELKVQALGVMSQAETDAERLRAEAEEAAAATRQAAEQVHAEAEERSGRRIGEAESGARMLREQVAAEVARGQREAQDVLSKARAEAQQLIDEAAAEADRLRERARAMLDEARSEVTALTYRRDDIVRELGEVSGVIAALAVPTAARFAVPKAERIADNRNAEPVIHRKARVKPKMLGLGGTRCRYSGSRRSRTQTGREWICTKASLSVCNLRREGFARRCTAARWPRSMRLIYIFPAARSATHFSTG